MSLACYHAGRGRPWSNGLTVAPVVRNGDRTREPGPESVMMKSCSPGRMRPSSPPGQFFDGRGVVAQAISLKRELSVLLPELGQSTRPAADARARTLAVCDEPPVAGQSRSPAGSAVCEGQQQPRRAGVAQIGGRSSLGFESSGRRADWGRGGTAGSPGPGLDVVSRTRPGAFRSGAPSAVTTSVAPRGMQASCFGRIGSIEIRQAVSHVARNRAEIVVLRSGPPKRRQRECRPTSRFT